MACFFLHLAGVWRVVYEGNQEPRNNLKRWDHVRCYGNDSGEWDGNLI